MRHRTPPPLFPFRVPLPLPHPRSRSAPNPRLIPSHHPSPAPSLRMRRHPPLSLQHRSRTRILRLSAAMEMGFRIRATHGPRTPAADGRCSSYSYSGGAIIAHGQVSLLPPWPPPLLSYSSRECDWGGEWDPDADDAAVVNRGVDGRTPPRFPTHPLRTHPHPHRHRHRHPDRHPHPHPHPLTIPSNAPPLPPLPLPRSSAPRNEMLGARRGNAIRGNHAAGAADNVNEDGAHDDAGAADGKGADDVLPPPASPIIYIILSPNAHHAPIPSPVHPSRACTRTHPCARLSRREPSTRSSGTRPKMR
ncbi:hypothetical protein DFH07DRAFT_967180 [Mycena maculata]|uniref:Uncharacterized protein n=1 Tax=Mycena maculata TaxID=230809 RepID=A0AAD7I5I0_9AGAR|nr:hypothetical protein DFH07DRAFT_967180 [Mycena maculata]